MENDLYMPYWQASAHCQALGPGWRLPTFMEMTAIRGLNDLGVGKINSMQYYWVGKDPSNPGDPNYAYVFNSSLKANPWYTETTKSFRVVPVKDIKDK
jgi:hypothetical protein